MQLAHAGDDRFLGLRVEIAMEGRILFHQLLQGAGELGLVVAAFRRDRQVRPWAWGT